MEKVTPNLLPILAFPDPRLAKVAAAVRPADLPSSRYAQLAADMFATMYEAGGIGLAATQVDVHERFIVMDLSEDQTEQRVLINPQVVWASEEKEVGEEGCLSVPDVREAVPRSVQITVKALGLDGAEHTIQADGLLAVCIQHEMDHLMGKVFVEYLSPLKRSRIKTKLEKAQRRA